MDVPTSPARIRAKAVVVSLRHFGNGRQPAQRKPKRRRQDRQGGGAITTPRHPEFVFDRRYVSPCAGVYDEPGRCDHCGRDLVALGDRQRNCSRDCRKAIQQLPHDERARRRSQTPNGLCVNCGASLPPTEYHCARARNTWIKRWRAASGGRLRFGRDAFEWLGGKLGVDPSDERLPAIALKLAQAGRLSVLVDGDRVIGIAKPRTEEKPQP